MDRYISTIYSSVFLIVLTILSINVKAQSSPYISGPACVVAGKSANYSISNLPSGSSNYKMTWCATGGKIVGAGENESCKTQTPLYSITVQWNATNTQGSGYISFKSVDGNNAVITELSTNPTIKPVLQGGSITSAQTQNIAYYTTPSIINCSASSGGACTPSYAYQWQQSYNNVDWTDVAGKTTQNLSITNPLFQTTYYRRKVTETTSSDIEYSSSATVFVAAPFSMKQIDPPVQNIYINQIPATLTGGAASGGSCGGSYTYEWYYSTDGGVTYPVNQKISGATGTSYSPPTSSVVATKYFRRKDICGSLFSYNTPCVVNWYNHLTSGTITSPATTIDFYTSPGTLTTTTVSGGICSQIQYQWQTSADGITYTNTGVTAMSYNPGKLIQKLYIRCKYQCDETTYSNIITINVNPQLFPGSLMPNNISVATNTSPGQLTTNAAWGGACNGSYTYEWQKSADAGFASYTAVSTTQNYTPGNLTATTYYRRAVTCGTDIQYTNTCTVTIGAPTSYNYVQERVITKPGIATETAAAALTDIADVKQTTQYFDGLGRPLQTVSKAATPAGTDMVAISTYDEYGREAIKYLTYAATSTDGKYKPTALPDWTTFNTSQFSGEQFFYSRTEFEPSQLNRPSASFAPGNSWAGANRGVSQNYYVNRTADAVRQWSCTYSNTVGVFGTYTTGGTYPEGDLAKTITTDENGKQVIEFKDKQDRTVLKKVQLTASADDGTGSGYTGWLCTYYIYDDYGNLRCVVQPRGVELLIQNGWDITALSGNILDEQCFRYEYDERNRMVEKKVPGAEPVYMVYDNRDRLVFTQDGNLRSKSQWAYTTYDEVNRPVQTGIMKYTDTWANLKSYVKGVSNATTDQATSGTIVDAIVTDLVLPERETGRTLYNATSSIVLDNGFSSEDGAVFNAEIISGSNTSFTGNILVNTSPIPVTGSTLYPLTYIFYDDYDWTGKAYTTVNNSQLDDGGNSYADALPSAATKKVQGMVTGKRVRVLEDPNNLNTGDWMETASFYDDKGRAIQVNSDNYKGGKDISTSRYDFVGKIVSSQVVHNNAAGNSNNLLVKTSMLYDHAARVKTINKTIINGSVTSTKVIAQNGYNELGQLKTKKLGTDPLNTANPLETLTYDYNIRGWLLGMNRDYAKSTSSTANFFGFDLGYDKTTIKPTSGATLGVFVKGAYNGNITGMVWKSTGDKQVRKYDFTYDAANRLKDADFKQYSTVNSAFDVTDGIDFSASVTNYDANGNILNMQQTGLKVGGSSQIDDLTYKYIGNNSNKLKCVIDGLNDPTSALGDFKYSASYTTQLNGTKPTTAIDYTYDDNGNLTIDKNKNITGIVYNHLNLPWKISVKNDDGSAKGIITYIYDAEGNKLEKRTNENAAASNNNISKQTVTAYISAFVYENNVLKFFGQEEGRIRPITPSADNGNQSYAFDYFLKDHLGNVRSMITEEMTATGVYQATMETANRNNEVLLFGDKVNTTAQNPKPAGFDADGSNSIVSKVNGTSAENRVGPGVILKVMAGDKFNAKTFAWYQPTGMNNNSNTTLQAIAVNLASQLVPGIVGSAAKGTVGSQVTNSSMQPGIQQFLNTQVPASGGPKAYLNWVLFDEELFKPVTNNSGFISVPAITGTAQKQLLQANSGSDITITKNGYLYVYVSNESQGNVYFDDIRIEHKRGPLLEESHYYPFGLTMAGISSEALGFGGSENKRLFNSGSELQNKEFSDGSGLEMYDTHFRQLDPQLGRWWQIDPKPDYAQSLYSAMGNNPILYNDPLGDTTFLYNRAGVYKSYINDGLKTNEIVVAGGLKIGLLKLGKTLGFISGTQAGLTARSASFADARITNNTVKELTAQWTNSDKGERTGFLYADSKTKEVHITVCGSCTAQASNEVSVPDSKAYANASKMGIVIGAWHTHPPASSFDGINPSSGDYENPALAIPQFRNGALGVIVNENTISPYAIHPLGVTLVNPGEQDEITTPKYGPNYTSWRSDWQNPTFNSNVNSKTYWNE